MSGAGRGAGLRPAAAEPARRRHLAPATRRRRRKGARRRPTTASSCFIAVAETSLRPVRVVALRELGDDALEVEFRFAFAPEGMQRGAEVVEHAGAIAVVRIGVDQEVEALHGRVPAVALDVEARDEVLVLREAVEHVLTPRGRLVLERAVRI